ncbi:hypothetical protein CR513_54358, partial [Mucuna pruriens]
MHFFQGSYQPQPHIAEELLKFPDKSLTVKQIQQFLGIVNYIRDFIPNVAIYTSPLSKLLKKDPLSWGPDQTKPIQELKRIAQSPPALKIPEEGKRILPTNASDFYWGAVIIEEQGNEKYYCGHASGQFKEAERHYHTTFKEALAVKNGIKKFDFHLRKYHFEVQMDNSSFPKILEFKNKMPPDPQILRLKDWLSRYDFSVKHIKGKQNLIPDFLSRLKKSIQMITSTHSFPIIFMVKPSSKKAKTRQKPLSNKAKTCRFFPPGLTPTSHPDILEYAKSHYFYFIHETMKYKVTAPFMFSPNNPYGGVFELFCDIGWDLQEATLWAIWCKMVEYSIPISLRTKAAYDKDDGSYLKVNRSEGFGTQKHAKLNQTRKDLKAERPYKVEFDKCKLTKIKSKIYQGTLEVLQLCVAEADGLLISRALFRIKRLYFFIVKLQRRDEFDCFICLVGTIPRIMPVFAVDEAPLIRSWSPIGEELAPGAALWRCSWGSARLRVFLPDDWPSQIGLHHYWW